MFNFVGYDSLGTELPTDAYGSTFIPPILVPIGKQFLFVLYVCAAHRLYLCLFVKRSFSHFLVTLRADKRACVYVHNRKHLVCICSALFRQKTITIFQYPVGWTMWHQLFIFARIITTFVQIIHIYQFIKIRGKVDTLDRFELLVFMKALRLRTTCIM